METSPEILTVQCPNCDFELQFSPITFIKQDDQNLEDLFNGQLNRFSCTQCSTETIYQTSILFCDPSTNYYIFYNPDGEKLGYQKTEENMDLIMNSIFKSNDAGLQPDCRVTIDRNSFLEKISASSKGLNDKILEYLKLQAYVSNQEYNFKKHVILFDFSRSDTDNLIFTIMDKETGKAFSEACLPFDVYTEVEELYESGNADYNIDSAFSGYFVHAEKFLMEKEDGNSFKLQ